MNLLLCDIAKVLVVVVNVYTLALLVYAIVSWVPDLRRGRWVYYLAAIIEPVLIPIRRIIPPLGGLDIAFLVLLLFLQWPVRSALYHLAQNTCYLLF